MEYVEILLMCIVAAIGVFALFLFIAPFIGVIIIRLAKIIDIFVSIMIYFLILL